VAFVLSGGGSLGSVQVGCLEALLRHGIYPDLIVGTSVGSLNGAFLATDPTLARLEELKQMWLGLRERSIFGQRRSRVLLRLMLGSQFMHANGALRQLVCRSVGASRFEDLAVPLVVVATRLGDGGLKAFDSGPLESALMASTAIPGVFPAVRVDGVEYVDGALASNCGIGPAREHGGRRFVVVECPHPPPEEGFGVLKPLARALWASMIRICHLEVASFAGTHPVVRLEPAVSLQSHRFDDFSQTPALIEEARAWTEQVLTGPEGTVLRSFARDGKA
jgi:NTE family protein